MPYRKRIVDKILENKLESSGAVLVTGPRWCGKTTTAEQKAKSILYLDNPKNIKQNLQLSETDPELLLEGETPRLIDEWQLAPSLWDTIRFVVDHRENSLGQFILTGSSTPIKKEEIHHSGLGRFSILKMRNMSLYESGESTGDVSLKELFSSPSTISGHSLIRDLRAISFIIARGGWPEAIGKEGKTALLFGENYYDILINSAPFSTSKKAENLLKSYARNQGTTAPISLISKDTGMDDGTTKKYIELLENMFVIEDLSAWNPNLRSKTVIRTTPTRYFSDPSIAVESLKLGPEDLIKDLNTMGFFFETLCIRDLRIYAEAMRCDVYKYKDSSGLECDAVLHYRDGEYGLCEIKLGGNTLIESGSRNLKKLEEKLDDDKMGKPSFKMILTATGDYAYTRKDGIHVVPIGTLGP